MCPPLQPQRGPDAYKRFLAIARLVPKKGTDLPARSVSPSGGTRSRHHLGYRRGRRVIPGGASVRAGLRVGEPRPLAQIHIGRSKGAPDARMRCIVEHSITNPENGDEEGLPAAIQEAMAHGMAVVSTRHAGIPEAVVEGQTGLLVDEGDVEGMARAFLQVTSSASVLGNAGYSGKQSRNMPGFAKRAVCSIGLLSAPFRKLNASRKIIQLQ